MMRSRSMTNPSEPKKPISEAKRASNARNAKLHSTGPKTAAGKAVSRGNAFKHGFCAKVIDVPDENPELFGQRLDTWNEELNPLGLDAGRFLVARAVSRSIRLQRHDLVYDAKVAHL